MHTLKTTLRNECILKRSGLRWTITLLVYGGLARIKGEKSEKQNEIPRRKHIPRSQIPL